MAKRKPKLNLSPDAARQAATYLREAFYWDGTPQGFEYWEEVVKNIDRLIKRSRRPPGKTASATGEEQ